MPGVLNRFTLIRKGSPMLSSRRFGGSIASLGAQERCWIPVPGAWVACFRVSMVEIAAPYRVKSSRAAWTGCFSLVAQRGKPPGGGELDVACDAQALGPLLDGVVV